MITYALLFAITLGLWTIVVVAAINLRASGPRLRDLERQALKHHILLHTPVPRNLTPGIDWENNFGKTAVYAPRRPLT